MHIPETFGELLKERIRFCEDQMQALKRTPHSGRKLEAESIFSTGLENLLELQRMATVVKDARNSNTKPRFKQAAKALVAEMISTICDQVRGVRLLKVKQDSLDLLKGLEKIYREIENI